MFFMPKEDRSLQNFPSVSSSTGSKEPCSNTNGLDGSLLVPSDEYGTPVTFLRNQWNPTGNPETDCYDWTENTRKPTGNPKRTDQHSEVPKPVPQFHRSEKNRAQPRSVFINVSTDGRVLQADCRNPVTSFSLIHTVRPIASLAIASHTIRTLIPLTDP